MTKLQIRAYVFQLASFAILFFSFRYLISHYTSLQGFWKPLTSFVIATILAPKFQATRTKEGEKLFMSWIFIKGIKQIG